MKRSSVLGFLAGAAILSALIAYAGVRPVALAVQSLGFSGLCLIAAVHLAVVGLLGVAWFLPARRFKGARPRDFIWARLVRDSAGEVLPFSQVGGYAAGVRVLVLADMETLPAAMSTLADLIVELAGKLPYLLLGLAFLAWLRAPARLVAPVLIALGVAAIPVALAFARLMRRRNILETFGARMISHWPALASGSAKQMRSIFADLLAPDGRIGSAFLLHFGCWVLGGFEAWLLFQLMGIGTGISQAIVIDSLLSTVRTFAFFVPGAVGVQEASYAIFGALFGITPATAIAFSLARRARDIAIGVPTLLVWNLQESRRARRGAGLPVRATPETRDDTR